MHALLTAATAFVVLHSALTVILALGLAVWIVQLYVVTPIRMRGKPRPGNSRLPSPVPERPGSSRCRFPTERDPKRLYALHRARVAAAGKRQRPIRIEDSVAYQIEREDLGRLWMVESGYHTVDGERLRSTWKGAFLGVWRFLPPWRTLESLKDELMRRTLMSGLDRA